MDLYINVAGLWMTYYSSCASGPTDMLKSVQIEIQRRLRILVVDDREQFDHKKIKIGIQGSRGENNPSGLIYSRKDCRWPRGWVFASGSDGSMFETRLYRRTKRAWYLLNPLGSNVPRQVWSGNSKGMPAQAFPFHVATHITFMVGNPNGMD
ncbi:hypothetical protein AVEN_196705-1 [Araneus ventricosus]|uniref:Uncharacterized protein n=1 Tax=Araneus ventricosus TaxID=182803 RepID=A0A4Y2H0C4_ARAVE|nr:hypothetical protein AVEN_196705-1 [Araneus ventricosus]